MNIKRHTLAKEKRAELSNVKSCMQIGLFALAAIEIFCHFFEVPYIDYVILFVSFAECGLFIYGYLLNLRISRSLEFSSEKYESVFDFHDTFITSIIIPLIFIFTSNNTSFENTRILDFELFQKITILITLGVMLYYKLVHYVSNKMIAAASTEEQEKVCERRITAMITTGTFFDAAIELCLSLHFVGMFNKEPKITTYSALFAVLVVAILFSFNRINEKKHIFKISLCVFTALYILFGIYDIYLEKSTTEIHLGATEYYAVNAGTEYYCRFEENAEGIGVLKYVIIATDAEGDAKVGTCVYTFTARHPTKGIFRWYDAVSKSYIRRTDISKDAAPIVLSVRDEKTQMDEGFPLSASLDKKNYSLDGVTEWFAKENDTMIFRRVIFKETTVVPTSVQVIFDAMKV